MALSSPLLAALSLFLYTHRRMAITGDDVSLDQIVPVSRDFTLEEGATEGWGYESISYGLPGHFSSCWGWGIRKMLVMGCSVAKGLFASLPTVSPDGEVYILGEWSFQWGYGVWV